MWIGKFKIKHECFILSKIKNNDLKVLAYVLGVHEDKKNLFYTTFLIPIGRDENKAKFIADMKKDKQVISIEHINDQLITLTKVAKNKKHVSSNFTPDLFLIEPILHEKEHEYWHLASWDREKLIAFYNKTKKTGEIEILKLQKEKPSSIFFPRIMPSLSKQQHKAFELAMEFGYYQYPQKVHLEDLAKVMKISRMTYREHLKKAQSKLIPFFANTIVQKE